MLGFYPSAAHSYYSARPVYSDDIISLHPPTSDYFYLPRTTDPESHYRRALAKYLVAEEELFRAREEAASRARVEALQRQEEARLLQERIIRARKRAASIPERRRTPISSVLAAQIPQTHVTFSEGESNPSIPRLDLLLTKRAHDRSSPAFLRTGPQCRLWSLFSGARLRKIASDNQDEDVQNLARATLNHLAQYTPERDANDTSGLSPETKIDSATRSPEASKTIISPLETIQDIRATLSKFSADFSIPPSLDFSDDEDDGLAYTPTNAPIRAYEHALEGLLAQLDAVESDGDEGEVVTSPTSPTRPATVQDELLIRGTFRSRYIPIAEKLIPADEPSVSVTSGTREETVSLSAEGVTLTSTPVSPAFLPPALPDGVSALRMVTSPRLKGEGVGQDDDDDDIEDGWSEVEV
ncbi:hypothetical protein H4582DRAFT_2205378 [Lactarius indigo]|nr:hypothetical protein H4582DRAFT_2205378 [Lactarius indigo]